MLHLSVCRTTNLLWALVVTLLMSASPVWADDSFSYHPMRFEHITLDDGLSQSNVLSILQDSRGQMWFGTENGLNSYNGYEFSQHRREHGNTAALRSDFIFDVAEDANGDLWVATNGGGLSMLDLETGEFTTYRHDASDTGSIGSNVVRRVLVDSDGSIWAGTREAGLSRLDRESGKFSHYRLTTSVGPDKIFALLQDSSGAVWAGGDHGLSRIDHQSGETTTYMHHEGDSTSLSPHSVRAVFEDSSGQLWAGTFGGGLHRFSAEDGSFTRFVHAADVATSISGNEVSSIYEDSAQRFWVGTTEGLNLVNRDNGEFVRYLNSETDANSLADNSVTVILEDRGGVLWIGTKMRGISKWNSRTWAYGYEPGTELTTQADAKPVVTSFVEDLQGRLWIGTFGDGVNVSSRGSDDVVRYRHDAGNSKSISDDRVMSLMRDREGAIWIGTMTRGIDRIDPISGEIDRFRFNADDPTSLSANGIMAMYEDSAGSVWVGTFGGGISRFNPATQTFDRLSASSDRVTSFVEDNNGRIWIGTDAGGLNVFNPKNESFHSFRHDPNDPKTLADDTVYALNVDANGTVWAGTRGGGLNRVVGDASRPAAISFDNVSTLDGLSNDVVYGIEIDRSGQLWMSTNYGISQYDPDSGEITILHRNDGLQSEEFNFGAHYRSDTGELFFGGNSGYNAFEPNDLHASVVVPAVMLTAFHNMSDPTKSDLPIDENEGVDLGYRDDVVSFEFAALDFAAPSKNQFAYKLEGFDKDWISLGNERRVTYTDLDAGNYLLRVKAANSAGVWNESGIALPVRVAAPPWATWWAYLAYLGLIVQGAALLWTTYKRKIKREEEYSHRLEQEVESRTEQLTDRNKQLKLLNQALQESSLSDPLTGLRNRRFVFEEVSRDLEVVKRRFDEAQQGVSQHDTVDLIFMMIDLDNFKPINDTYGHAAGDEMLLQVRDALLNTCRRSDFVIRWGGDEFLVIAKQTRPDESEALAERIRSTIADTNFSLGDGQIVRTTCSIGFAAYPLFRAQLDESGLDQIIGLADGLMYEAKKKRDAWAGMFKPNEASTSFIVEEGELEPTSLLFQAKRAGKLLTHNPDAGDVSATTFASGQY